MVSSRLEKLINSRVIGPLAVMLAVVLALLVLLVSELGQHQSKMLTREREATVNAQLTVAALRRNLLIMESATRGYLATGRTEYLAPYERIAPSFAGSLAKTQRLSLDELHNRPDLEKLVILVTQKQSNLDDMVRLFKMGDRIGALMAMESDVGLHTMKDISYLVDDIVSKESAKFTLIGEARDRSAFINRLMIWLLVTVSLVGAALLTRLGRARERDEENHISQLQTERDQLDKEVVNRTAESVSLALHMERVREDEKGRLARELHDELGGLLTAAKLDVARIRKRLPEIGTGLDLLKHLSQSLDSGIALKRRIIEDLRPSSLSNLGLQSTLLIQCREFSERAEIKVTTDIADISLPEEHALAVYRIVQEALTNVAKYAGATEVSVSMAPVDGCLEVRVADNGKGFDLTVVQSTSGRGLQGMKFRVQACGGELHIKATLGNGTELIAILPLMSTSQYADA